MTVPVNTYDIEIGDHDHLPSGYRFGANVVSAGWQGYYVFREADNAVIIVRLRLELSLEVDEVEALLVACTTWRDAAAPDSEQPDEPEDEDEPDLEAAVEEALAELVATGQAIERNGLYYPTEDTKYSLQGVTPIHTMLTLDDVTYEAIGFTWEHVTQILHHPHTGEWIDDRLLKQYTRYRTGKDWAVSAQSQVHTDDDTWYLLGPVVGSEESSYCKCGEATNERCEAQLDGDAVIVEWMPPYLRGLHREAERSGAGRGRYPNNGSRRFRATRECAESLCASDSEWCSIVDE